MRITSTKLGGFFNNPSAHKSVLLYGNDPSRINLYSQKIVQHIDLDGASLISKVGFQSATRDLEQLFVTLNTTPLFHRRSIVLLTDAKEALCPSLKAILNDINPNHCFVIIQAQELPGSSSLKVFYDNHPTFASLGCYKGNDIRHIVREFLEENNVTYDGAAFKALSTALQSSNACIQPELRKLLLYLGGEKKLSAKDVQNCLSGDLDPMLDDICSAVAEGDLVNFLKVTDALLQNKTSPVLIVRSSMKYFITLEHLMRKVKRVDSVDAAIKSVHPPIFFRLIPQFERHLRTVKYSTVCTILRHLFDAEARLKLSDSTQETTFKYLMQSLIAHIKAQYLKTP